MNFTDSTTDVAKGEKLPARKSNMADETPGESHLDKEAMEGAKAAEGHQHQNENTNSSNTIFSK